jgi:glycosyltransferase 2 family protein
MSRSRVRHYVLVVVKVGLACLLLWWLTNQAQKDDSFYKLRDQPKHWGMLALATLACFGAVVITIYRWMLLVRALKIPFSVGDAFRLGFQSYALNFVSLGSIGGDLFKAVFIAREQPGRRPEAVATVVIDRLVGLYALLLVSAGAIVLAWWQGAAWLNEPELKLIVRVTIICTILGGILCIILALPNFTRGHVAKQVERLPLVGPTMLKLLGAIHLYRSQRGVMAFSLFISLFVHLLMALSVWLVGQGLPGNSLTLAENIVAVPLAALAGAMPITPSGLGAFEGVLNFLYNNIAAPGTIDGSQGFIVALGFRLLTMIVALPGVYYIIRGRRKVAEVMHEVEEEEEAGEL